MNPLALLAGSDIATIAVGLLVLLGGLVTAVVSLRSNANTSAVAIVGSLTSRLSAVEAQNTQLMEDGRRRDREMDEVKVELSKSNRVTSAAVKFVEKLADRLRGAGIPVPAAPDELHEYLDPDRWRDDDTGSDPKG